MSDTDHGEATAMSVPLEIIGIVSAVLLCAVVLIFCRIWKRNRYYKKVQHSLDEEERAFQETLARGYNDEQHLDGGDHERLQMLETYLQMQAEAGGGAFEGVDDFTVLRFLRAAKGSAKHARRRYADYVAWRAAERVDEIESEMIPPDAELAARLQEQFDELAAL